MVSNIPNSTYIKGGESYNIAPEGSGATATTTGDLKLDSNIPLQIWQARAGKAMNIMKEKVRFRVDPAQGGVVMETASPKSGAGIVTGNSGSPADGAKGLLFNWQG